MLNKTIFAIPMLSNDHIIMYFNIWHIAFLR